KQLDAIDRCGRLHGFYPEKEGLTDPSPNIEFDKCPWSMQHVRDLVIPLAGQGQEGSSQLVGMLRFHYSRPSGSATSDPPLSDDFSQIEGTRRDLGNLLVHVRAVFRNDPVKLKVEREWERLIFERL